MPIDPNIALSYRQPEPINMLGQLGQVMAIKAAQQEMEGYEGVKGALSSGMEATDPRLLQYGKRGIEAFKAANEGRIKQLEAVTKQSQLLGSIFGGVMQDPSSGPAALKKLESMGIVKPDEAQAILAQAGNDPAAWKALAKPYYDQSIDATKRFQDETERWKANLQAQVTREGHGVQMYGHNITARGQDLTAKTAANRLEFDKQKRNVIAGENQFLQTDPYGNIYPVGQYGPVNGPNALAPNQPAPVNALVNPESKVAPAATAGVTEQPQAAPAITQQAPRPPLTATQQKEKTIVEKIPEAIDMSKDAIRKIDEMIGGVDAKGNPLPGEKGKPHPGFEGAVGAGFGMQYIPGTEARGFRARHEEVLGQAFLDAYEILKGGGAITDVEGAKATKARARMDLATSEKEYITAAREFQGVLRRGIENAEKKLQRSGGAVAPTIKSTGNVADPLGLR